MVQNIKNLARLETQYANHWEAIDLFIEEDALAAFFAGLSKTYFGYAQPAKPAYVREAYAFLCQFTCNESIRVSQNKGSARNTKQESQNLCIDLEIICRGMHEKVFKC